MTAFMMPGLLPLLIVLGYARGECGEACAAAAPSLLAVKAETHSSSTLLDTEDANNNMEKIAAGHLGNGLEEVASSEGTQAGSGEMAATMQFIFKKLAQLETAVELQQEETREPTREPTSIPVIKGRVRGDRTETIKRKQNSRSASNDVRVTSCFARHFPGVQGCHRRPQRCQPSSPLLLPPPTPGAEGLRLQASTQRRREGEGRRSSPSAGDFELGPAQCTSTATSSRTASS